MANFNWEGLLSLLGCTTGNPSDSSSAYAPAAPLHHGTPEQGGADGANCTFTTCSKRNSTLSSRNNSVEGGSFFDSTHSSPVRPLIPWGPFIRGPSPPVSPQASSRTPSPGTLRNFQNFSGGLDQVGGSSIQSCIQACSNTLASGYAMGGYHSKAASAMENSFPSRHRSLPLVRGEPKMVQNHHVSAPVTVEKSYEMSGEEAVSPSYANVVLNFNYGMGLQWGQAKRLPGHQFGSSAGSADITPSFRLPPHVQSTPVHPADPNRTPSSLFDSQPSSGYFEISAPIKHLFDSRLLGNHPSPPSERERVPCTPANNFPFHSRTVSAPAGCPRTPPRMPQPGAEAYFTVEPTSHASSSFSPVETPVRIRPPPQIVSPQPNPIPRIQIQPPTPKVKQQPIELSPVVCYPDTDDEFAPEAASSACNLAKPGDRSIANDAKNVSKVAAGSVMDVMDLIAEEERAVTLQGVQQFHKRRREQVMTNTSI